MPVTNEKVEGEVLPCVYGPVLSRRHGHSLGINVGSDDHKVCTWSCLYCQCGFGSVRDFHKNENRPELADILDEVRTKVLATPNLDSVTLAGNTEPGTYPEILLLVKGLIKLRLASRGKWKLVILSNGSELDNPDAVQAFNLADECWIKLDVGVESLFRQLNRPTARVGTLADHIERIKKLKKIRIQTMIWSNEKYPNLANDHIENIQGLEKYYAELQPIAVDLMTVERTPAMDGILPVQDAYLISIQKSWLAKSIPVRLALLP